MKSKEKGCNASNLAKRLCRQDKKEQMKGCDKTMLQKKTENQQEVNSE